jgi:hypothetical protein
MGSHLRTLTRSALLAAILSLLCAASASAALPWLGAAADSVSLRSVPGETAYGSWHAVPLRAARPSWYTDALAARVHSANGQPVAAPIDAPFPSEVGIRPGSWMIEPYGCTMNFIFGSPGSYAIGTAGHCVDNGSQHVVLLTLAPNSGNPVLVDIGTAVKRQEAGIGKDFALISIRSDLQRWVSPTTSVMAGPCGRYFGYQPHAVFHYGHGLAIGTGGTPRAGLAITWQADAYGWDGEAIFGDSGSPVRIDRLQGAGNLTHLVVDTHWVPSFIAGTRIAKMEQIAGRPMANSPLCASTTDLNDGGSPWSPLITAHGKPPKAKGKPPT